MGVAKKRPGSQQRLGVSSISYTRKAPRVETVNDGGGDRLVTKRALPPVPTAKGGQRPSAVRSGTNLDTSTPATVPNPSSHHLILTSQNTDRMTAVGGKATGPHPLGAFDDLLEAFDDYIDGRLYSSSMSEGSPPVPFNPSTDSVRLINSPGGHDGDNCNRLPRLHSSPSAQQGAPGLAPESRSSTKIFQRTTTEARAAAHPPFTPAAPMPNPSLAESETPAYCLDDNPFDLMLRSKDVGRVSSPYLSGETTASTPFVGFEAAVDTKKAGLDLTELGTKFAENMGKFPDRAGATAGVFRLSHRDSGFIHYGYSWDLRGVKAEQLRRLTRDHRAGSAGFCHPHKGLSALVQNQQERRLKMTGGVTGNSTRQRSDCIFFEVVREISLPSRFRANEFDDMLSHECSRALSDRRSRCLVLTARRYRLKRCDSVLRHFRNVCRQEAEDEEMAAAVEIQRIWRGSCGRTSACEEHERRETRRLQSERERLGLAIAVWGQVRCRGRAGRRLASEIRRKQANERMEAQRFSAAAAIQAAWGSYRKCRRETPSSNAVKEQDPIIVRELSGVDEDESAAAPLAGQTASPLTSDVRGPPRPVTPSEIRVASQQDAYNSDETSLSLAASDQTPPSTPQPQQQMIDSRRTAASAGATRQCGADVGNTKRRRPSSSRRIRVPFDAETVDTAQLRCRRESSVSMRKQRPSSGGAFHSTGSAGGDDSFRGVNPPWSARSRRRPVVGNVGCLNMDGGGTCSPARDASLLVLEGRPSFTAATTIQAGWRGFVVRLARRKKRRADVVLRRKREGKWRQQRGVVGKQVSVGWDDRRELEQENGVLLKEHGGGRSACVDIQVTNCMNGGGFGTPREFDNAKIR